MTVKQRASTTAFSKLLVFFAAISFSLLGTAPAGFAVSGSGADPENIDSTREGSLSIYKHMTPAGAEGDGTEQASGPQSPAVQGVTFQIERVSNIDIATNNGLAEAAYVSKQLKDGTAIADLTLKDGTALTYAAAKSRDTSGDKGMASFTNLPLGVYLVKETSVENATVNGKKKEIIASKPFFVTIPFTNPNKRQNWLYDAHVYPKNAPLITVEKSVNDSSANVVGNRLEYTVLAEIPQQTDSKGIPDKYVIIDPLNSHLENPSVRDVTIMSTPAKALAESTDYTISKSNNTLKVTFTQAGREKLGEAITADSQVKVRLRFFANLKNSEATTNNAKALVIPNKAYVAPSTKYSDDPTSTTNPPIPSNEVESRYVKLEITKLDVNDNKKPLEGAVFSLGLCSVDRGVPEIYDFLEDNITTNSEGKAVVKKLRVLDFVNNKEVKNNEEHYCLLETQAPTGYSLLAKPIVIDVKTDTPNATHAVKVTNAPKNLGFDLPLTGSSAFIVMVIGGGLLIIGAIFLAIRRKNEDIES